MIRTITKRAILAAGLAVLSVPSYADDANQLLLGQEGTNTPTTLTDTEMPRKRNEYPEQWTGFYGGISVGGNFSSASLQSNQVGFINPDGTCNTKTSLDSFFPGVQFGYSHQFDSNVVLGAEGDFTYNTQERDNIRFPCPAYLRASDRFRVQNRLQGSLRGRLGYALGGNWLPFVSAGISFADIGLNYGNEGGDGYNKSSTQVGWLVGGGLEWGFSDKLSVRGEYYYKAYDGLNMPITGIYGITDPNGTSHLNVHDNTVRVALNYWF